MNRLFWRLARLSFLLAGLLGAQAARAICITNCTCTTTITSVVFAASNPLQTANVDSVGNVRVGCSGGVGLLIAYNIALSAGVSNSISARTMANGAARLSYNLYTNNTFTTVWGDGSTGALVTGGVLLDLNGSSTPVDFPVYGRIPGHQTSVAPGAYTDNLVVTLTYF